MRAAAAFPALFSSIKLIVELIMSNTTIPRKSCQSGALPCIVQIFLVIYNLEKAEQKNTKTVGEKLECLPLHWLNL